MDYHIRHLTTFDYTEIVSSAHHMLHLTPRNLTRQHRKAFSMRVEPEPSTSTSRDDYFGNRVHYLTLNERHQRFLVESRARVEIVPAATTDLAASTAWETVGEQTAKALDAFEFCFASPYVDLDGKLGDYALRSFTPGRPILDAAMELTSRIFEEFEYRGGVSDISTPVLDVLEMRQGVCQDFAHLQIACLRSIGLAARYVSGYLLTHPPAGGKKLVGADASHAWLSVWSGDRWIDFDPTNNLIPSNEHITVGWGRDYGDVSPTTGFIIGGGKHEVSVEVDVHPVAD